MEETEYLRNTNEAMNKRIAQENGLNLNKMAKLEANPARTEAVTSGDSDVVTEGAAEVTMEVKREVPESAGTDSGTENGSVAVKASENQHKWYAVQIMNGHEKKVRRLLEDKIMADPAAPEERVIRQAMVPTTQVTEIKKGEKVVVERNIYPGYVLVEMILNEDALYKIGSTAGVARVMGQGRLAQPLRTEEVNRLLGIKEEQVAVAPKKDSYKAGETVQIISGPFAEYSGKIESVVEAKRKARVSVEMLGRKTTIEMDYDQLGDTSNE